MIKNYLKLKLLPFIFIGLISLTCIKNKHAEFQDFEFNQELGSKMNTIAESYVKLMLRIGQHDPVFIDAYYGPPEWKPDASSIPENDSAAIQNLYDQTGSLLDSLESLSNYKANKLETLRFNYLYKQILAAKAKLFMLAGGSFSFDEEAQALYDVDPPNYSQEHFDKIIRELDEILSGEGDITKRYNEFKEQFVIPKDKLKKVFDAAIKEARKRTLQNIELPESEDFKVEYVTDKPWGGYNWYQGNYFSLIQINTDLPIYIDRAVHLACHEGYPGHHVYNALLEKKLYNGLGWTEFSVYVLFSPQSLIAEGTANYAEQVTFPGNSKLEFEKKVLYPLAGLDSSKADEYSKVKELTKKLSYAGTEAARNYLNGNWNKEKTVKWLMNYSLRSKESAEKYLIFIEKYRSYVINYSLGEDIVKNYIERNGGTENHPEKNGSYLSG